MRIDQSLTSISIIGGGIFGLCCAWEMTRRGQKVRVFEARRLGSGSSGGHVGALAPHSPETWNEKKAFQLDSLLMAPRFWSEIETVSGLPSGYVRTGRIQPVADHATAERLQDRIDGSVLRWPEHMRMQLINRQEGMMPVSPSGIWLKDGLTARLNPRAAIAALAGAIKARGGEILENQPMNPDEVEGRALWATGSDGLHILSGDLGRAIGKGIKGQSALLEFDAGNAPQIFADGIHIVPHADGTVAIGSTSENEFNNLETDEKLDGLIAQARKICPQLADAPVIDRWAGLRPRAKSRAPLLGAWPGREGHFVVNGGFKIGFGMAPKIAVIMADLVLYGRAHIPDSFTLH